MDKHSIEDSLTPRERECFSLATEFSDKEIAAKLGIGVATVKTHLISARRKLGKAPRRPPTRDGRDAAPPPPSGLTPPPGWMAPPGAQPATLVSPDHPIGVAPEPVVREQRAIFGRQERQNRKSEATHELTIRARLWLIILAPVAIGCLILIVLAIFYQIDRLLPVFFPKFHPS